jgi:hypothetical protein
LALRVLRSEEMSRGEQENPQQLVKLRRLQTIPEAPPRLQPRLCDSTF